MVFRSIYPPLDIPNTNILSYIFPRDQLPSDCPIWIDAQEPQLSLSPRQALTWIKRLAIGLDNLGVPKGSAVMIFTPNHIFVPVAYLGIIGAGCMFSGANPTYTSSELQYQIRNTEAKVLLVHPSLVKTAVDAASKAGLPGDQIFQFSDRPCPRNDQVRDWRSMIGSEESTSTYTWDEMDNIANKVIATVNYSSGTTGLPKGVCVSHYNIIANTEQTVFMRLQGTGHPEMSTKSPERWLGVAPLYHAYGRDPWKPLISFRKKLHTD